MVDETTKKWIRNAADERAAANGCYFDEAAGQRVVDFFEQFLRLYEGERFAGQPFLLLDWQRDLLMRAFGWLRYSEHHQRPVRRFRKVCCFVPKKNGKSPLGAGVGLYLLIGDGERGQKVFSAAKDGAQARIMHTHAMKMVEQSPLLRKHCKINQSTGRISFGATNSTYSILSADNRDGQEGLNGSVIIDEIHVVDPRLAQVLKYMGASRAQPMQFEISTAGNNPQSYGRKQWEYGHAVNRGDFIDEQFLFVSYEAPQDATDEEIETNPAIWRQANPSMGHTINEEEFRSSLQEAKRSLTDWATFCMYRLNVWQKSANPWLKQDDWAKCYRRFNADDLAAQPCWLGLDLSKTRDMTAAVLVFPDDHYFQLPYFWLPEETAKNSNHLAPYLEWAKQGFLELTPGDVLDYGYVERRIVELSRQFNLQGIVYDKTYAEELTQRLQDQHGIERLIFEQSWRNYAAATAEYERLILGGRLHHNNHPILNWQAGHVQVKTDANHNKRPVKPSPDDPKKIDGIVAGVMALYASITRPVFTSVYETKGAVLGI